MNAITRFMFDARICTLCADRKGFFCEIAKRKITNMSNCPEHYDYKKFQELNTACETGKYRDFLSDKLVAI